MPVTTKKVGELAGNAQKCTEGSRRFQCLLWKVLEGDGNGRKLREGTGNVKKVLATIGKYVARNNVIGPRNEAAV